MMAAAGQADAEAPRASRRRRRRAPPGRPPAAIGSPTAFNRSPRSDSAAVRLVARRVRAHARRRARARRGRRRSRHRSRRRGADRARPRRRRPTRAGDEPIRGRGRAELDEPCRGIAVDAAPAMGRKVVEQRVAHEARDGTGSPSGRLDHERGEGLVEVGERRGPRARPTTRRTRRCRTTTPTTATRWSTSRVAGSMPVTMLASSAGPSAGSAAARRASSLTANGMPRLSAVMRAIAARGDARRRGGATSERDVVVAQRSEPSSIAAPWRSSEAVAGLGEGVVPAASGGG